MQRKERVLEELIKDSSRSDRQIAKAINISQPTVTRKRTELEKSGIIQKYQAMPNFIAIGFCIIDFMKLSSLHGRTVELQSFLKNRPEIIMQLGIGNPSIIILTAHKTFNDVAAFRQALLNNATIDSETLFHATDFVNPFNLTKFAKTL